MILLWDFFFISPQKHTCGYSFESPQKCNSNECTTYSFCGEHKKLYLSYCQILLLSKSLSIYYHHIIIKKKKTKKNRKKKKKKKKKKKQKKITIEKKNEKKKKKTTTKNKDNCYKYVLYYPNLVNSRVNVKILQHRKYVILIDTIMIFFTDCYLD